MSEKITYRENGKIEFTEAQVIILRKLLDNF